MTTNDLIALDAALEQSQAQRAPDLTDRDYFELFAMEQVLKDYQLTDDEIESGLVAGSDDGGVDGVYFFVNRQLVTDDSDIDPRDVTRAAIVFVQATRQKKFNTVRTDKLTLLTEDFLNLSLPEHKLAGTYNSEVLESMSRFKTQYRAFIHTAPEFSIEYFYVSKGDTKTINKGLTGCAERAIQKARELFSTADIAFRFFGAAELLAIIAQRPKQGFTLEVAEQMSPRGQEAYVCLVPLADYYEFIVDENGNQREALYESNVRHWQGDVRVNSEISATLWDGPKSEDFWWLNNGITILSSKANASGHLLTIEDPQVVNGLQTSRAIFDYFKARGGTKGEERNVLIRVIRPDDSESPARIIRATNSQTSMPDYQLHSTEKIHRDIENVLSNFGLFYDRQRKFYKNQGKPIIKIVEQLALAQSVISAVLLQPDQARARPSTILKRQYQDVFSEKYPLNLYVNCAWINKRIDAFLRSDAVDLERSHRVNLRWYVMMEYVRELVGTDEPTPKQISELKVPDDDQLIARAYQRVNDEYTRLGRTDQVAKGAELIAVLLEGDQNGS